MIDSEEQSIWRISELHPPSSLSFYHLFSLPAHFSSLKVTHLLKENKYLKILGGLIKDKKALQMALQASFFHVMVGFMWFSSFLRLVWKCIPN